MPLSEHEQRLLDRLATETDSSAAVRAPRCSISISTVSPIFRASRKAISSPLVGGAS